MRRTFRKAARSHDAPVYHYYIVENSFVARIKQNRNTLTAERMLEDGQWVAYNDVWDVCANGRYVDSEDKALAEFQVITVLRKNDKPK